MKKEHSHALQTFIVAMSITGIFLFFAIPILHYLTSEEGTLFDFILSMIIIIIYYIAIDKLTPVIMNKLFAQDQNKDN